MFWVYILYSPSSDKTYCGFTSNLEARLLSHNELGIKGYTLKFRPWVLLHKEEFSIKSDAMKREKYFKSGICRTEIKMLKEKFNIHMQ